MLAYVIRRLLFVIPTLLGIMVINFVIVQAAPGGPVEQMIAQIQGRGAEATARVAGSAKGDAAAPGPASASGQSSDVTSRYRGARGLDPEFIKELERLYGFDKPPGERFILMLRNYAVFDFGKSFFRDRPVIDLVIEKLPV